MASVHSDGELRFFTLVKSVIEDSASALRLFFVQEWDRLHSSTLWLNNEKSGACLLAMEKPTSRLFDPAHCKNYRHIKNSLAHGNIDKWDITTLVFAVKYSAALNPDGHEYRKRIIRAIENLKDVRNFAYCHVTKASVSQKEYVRVMTILCKAAGELLTHSHPLVEKIQQTMKQSEFLTEKVVEYQKQLEDDYFSLIVLEREFTRLEERVFIQSEGQERKVLPTSDRRNESAKDNNEIVCRLRHRVKKAIEYVDQVPCRSQPDVFQKRSYLTLMDKSNSLSFNFRWKDLEKFLERYFVRHVDQDIELFARIQAANALSLQSRKREAIEKFNQLTQLLSSAYRTRNGLAVLARIKLCKSYILHDLEDDEAAIREANEAEIILSTTECHEDQADVNYAIANIILSRGKNEASDRDEILIRVKKTRKLCDNSHVDKSVLKMQATIREALIYLGYYQHGIRESVPNEDIGKAKNILDYIAKQRQPFAKRSEVYFTMCKSLFAYRLGDSGKATKLEFKARKVCEDNQLHNEIQQLDELKQLIRASPRE